MIACRACSNSWPRDPALEVPCPEDMLKDELPWDWTDERPVIVSVSLHPDGESTVADIAAEQGVKPLHDFDALAMPEQSS